MTRQVLPDSHPSVPGPRSLGSRPGQACSGSDPRLYDPRATVLVNGVEVGLRKNIDLVNSGIVTIVGTDFPDTDTVQVTIGATGGGGEVSDGDKGDIVVTAGVWNIDATGTRDNSTFLRGDSTWSHVEVTRFPVKNTSGATLPIGTPVYATGSVGASAATEVAGADAGDSAKMPAIGILEQPLAHNAQGFAVPLGMVRGLNTSAYAMNGVVFVAVGGGLTTTRPTGTTQLVQNIGRVVRVHASTGEILVMGPGRTNDVQNLIPTSRLATSGTASSTTFLRGDQTWASVPASTGATGTAIVNFGAFPGSQDTSVFVPETSVTSGSVIQAWLMAGTTADHNSEEHMLETITVVPGEPIAGTGFIVYARNNSQLNEPLTLINPVQFKTIQTQIAGSSTPGYGGRATQIYGQWKIGWRWS